MAMATPPERVRHGKLSRDQIVATAVELAADEGLESLSIRTIATRLGVSPMALYRHVETKEEIVDLVVGHMLTQESEQTAWPTEWEDILREVATRLRALLHHPVVLETLQRRAVAGPHALDGMEKLLGAMGRQGIDSHTAVGLYGNTVAFVFGHAALQFGRERTRIGEGTTEEQERARLAEQIQALSSSGYPNVVAASDDVPRLFDDANFDAGIERLIRAVRDELATLRR